MGCSVMGCAASYTGQAKPMAPVRLEQEGGWEFVPALRGHKQSHARDCGAAAMATVLSYWGKDASSEELWDRLGRERATMASLRKLASDGGMRAFVIPGTLDVLHHEARSHRPVVIGLIEPHGRQGLTHYEVVVGFHPASQRIATFDPAKGFRVRSAKGLLAEWEPAKHVALVVLPAKLATADNEKAARR